MKLVSFRCNIIIHPLHIPLKFPCDYITQTGNLLKKRNLVLYFDFRYPISFGELLKEGSFLNFLRSICNICIGSAGELYFRPLAIFPFQRLDFIYKWNVTWGIIQLNFLLRLKRKKIIIWGFHPISEYIAKRFGKSFVIFDYVDLYGEENMEGFKKQDKNLLNRANLIVFNSQVLRDYKISKDIMIKDKSIVSVCGCDVSERISRGKNRNQKQRKIVIFAGQINYRIDYDLLNYVVKYNPNILFWFAGRIDPQYGKKFAQILSHKNAKYFSEINKTRLSRLYTQADLGIIPYKTSFATVKYSNPMKAYEYLNYRLPVVSTDILVLNKIDKRVLFCAKNKFDFARQINPMIASWDKAKSVIAWRMADQNKWENKINQIIEAIN